jgi:hypothetical protein
VGKGLYVGNQDAGQEAGQGAENNLSILQKDEY